MNLTFFGGANEIGGNKILLEDKGVRVYLDFGEDYFYEYSPKAEPIKLWLAKVGYERMQEMADPSKSLDRARETWLQHEKNMAGIGFKV